MSAPPLQPFLPQRASHGLHHGITLEHGLIYSAPNFKLLSPRTMSQWVEVNSTRVRTWVWRLMIR